MYPSNPYPEPDDRRQHGRKRRDASRPQEVSRHESVSTKAVEGGQVPDRGLYGVSGGNAGLLLRRSEQTIITGNSQSTRITRDT